MVIEDDLDLIVNRFARAVIAQNAAMRIGNHRVGNIHARKYIRCFERIATEYGNVGRERLAQLFDHDDPGVREMAAAFLLKYKTEEALRVLSELAQGEGLVAFGAGEAIRRWNEGNWNLDPT